jgi:poly-gamma-glutamate synthesis protein (capsule biosynthesis protein)
MTQPTETSSAEARDTTLFLCGDVMTGRGIDQVLPHPSGPHLFEPYIRSAVGYVDLAERVNGPIPKSMDFAYLWGDARSEWERIRPAARIVNLETAVTTAEDAWPDKGIHYRMHPANVPCLTVAGIDCCVLANNHVLDWGHQGLRETLDVLHGAGLRTAGAGRNAREAVAPAVIDIGAGRRVLVFAFGMESAGVPRDWAATDDRAGVSFMKELSPEAVESVATRVRAVKRHGDIVVASIHWGGNWGYRVPEPQRTFARRLIDDAAVDVVHGHSSHHPKGIEVYRGRPVLYGCGDFLNDYEGIDGHESFRSDLTLMYFPSFGRTGELAAFALTPMRVRRFRLERVAAEDAQWLASMLTREGRAFGTRADVEADGVLTLRWQ